MMGISSARHTYFPLCRCGQGLANVGLCRTQLKPDYAPDWVAGALLKRLKMLMRRALFRALAGDIRGGEEVPALPGHLAGAERLVQPTVRAIVEGRFSFWFQSEYQRYQERAYARQPPFSRQEAVRATAALIAVVTRRHCLRHHNRS